jgi:hypothetical protein
MLAKAVVWTVLVVVGGFALFGAATFGDWLERWERERWERRRRK